MQVLESPIVWKALPRYHLKNILDDFQIADFERQINNRHVRMLKDAIMQNKFYNNMICVTNRESPWVVFDGQHRLSALWLCHIEEGLKHYNLMLGIFPKEYARLAYRRINMGKPLRLKDHLKALDDKKTPFFTELSQWLTHHPRPDKLLYVNVIKAMTYARGYGKIASIETVDYVIEQTRPNEIAIAKKILQATFTHTPTTYGSRLYQSPIFRNLFKAAYKHNLSDLQISRLIDLLLKSNVIKEITQFRKHSDIVKVYEYMQEHLLPGIIK